ncbi:MAG: flagellar motor protein MotB [Myxococcota bacterium]
MSPIVIPSPSEERVARGSLPWVPGILFLVAVPVVLAGAAYTYDTLAHERAAAEMARLELRETRSRLAELAGEMQAKEGELSALRATYQELEQQLHSEIGRGEVQLINDDGRIRVQLVDQILFESGKATLSESGEDLLRRVGGVLQRLQDKQVQVSGHTDDSPPVGATREQFPTNWELSVARAVTVVRYLGERAHVPQKRLVAAGFGQFHPVGNNANHEGRARNRRIEILLTPMVEVQPVEKLSAGTTTSSGHS